MLPEKTQNIWQALAHRPELDGFVLVGGSALALHLNHRISEDLDFMWPLTRLPRDPLHRLTQMDPNLRFESIQSLLAQREAEDCLLELDDFSQNFKVNGEVKVTFFCPDRPDREILGSVVDRPLRVATVDEIFALKALVAAKRSKTRDWFDLYVLMKDHNYTWKDFYSVFVRARDEGEYDYATDRLCRGGPQSNDEGYTSLMPNPPSVEQMQSFFLERRNAYERGED